MSETSKPPLVLPPAEEPEPIEPLGYGRPPKSGRFRVGQSGNPRGRPARSKAVGSLVTRAFAAEIEAQENGKRRRISKLEAAVIQLVNAAAGGDQGAAKFLFGFLSEDKPAPGRAARPSSAADTLVISELVRRFGRRPE